MGVTQSLGQHGGCNKVRLIGDAVYCATSLLLVVEPLVVLYIPHPSSLEGSPASSRVRGPTQPDLGCG